MILSIGSSLPGFKAFRFRTGLNVILSSKAEDSQEGQTRNSAGKTSFVEVIHFLLGSRFDADSLFRHPSLIEESFHATFLIDGIEIRAERSGSSPSRIIVQPEAAEGLGLKTKVNADNGTSSVSNTEWTEFLGHKFLGLPKDLGGSAYDESFTPGFRSMISYFARRSRSGGFLSPVRATEKQQRWDWQVNLSYLLGLDWRAPHDLQKIRRREKTLEELRKASRGGDLEHLVGTASILQPLAVAAEAKAKKFRERLDRFEVVESYRELSAEAAQAKTEMQAIARRSVSFRETLAHLQEAIAQESVAPTVDLEALYGSVNIEFPGVVLRRFEAVSEFHKSVIANRRAHLAEEIGRVESELADGARRSKQLENRRTFLLAILKTGGALDDFIDLQKLLAGVEAEAASLRERLKTAEALERETTQLDIDRSNIKLRQIETLRGDGSYVEDVMLLIGSTISELYEDRSGGFEIEATDNGPEFRISIQGDRGTGISNMEIFCLDHALFSIWSQKSKGPGFLIHDSHLFDGVDERQIATALEIGRRTAISNGAQYIVCLNSDIFDDLMLDWDGDPDMVVAPMLTDREDGGLFGIRFD